MLARHILDNINIIFSLEQIMINKCAAPSCRFGYAKSGKKHIAKFYFLFEKFRTELTVDLICQPQRLETNKTLCFMRASFWREVNRSR